MSLWKIKQVNDVIAYRTCAGPSGGYFSFGNFWTDVLCTAWKGGSNPYRERLNTDWGWAAKHFFYWKAYDILLLFHIFDDYYSYWYMFRATFNADTGAQTTAHDDRLGNPAIYQLFQLWAQCGAEMGSYDKIYQTSKWDRYVREVDPGNLYAPDNGWSFDYSTLPSYPTSWNFFPPTHCLVNREDGYLGLIATGEVHVWKDFEGASPTYLGFLRLPSWEVHDVAYEDRERAWISMKGGWLVKINYQKMRVELLTTVQDPDPTDIAYLIAWDKLRGRLAVFRHRPDKADGSCDSDIEFYRPIPKAAQLTDPVPVAPLRAGKRIPFAFSLLGDAGEGISPYLVKASLTAPADGDLLTASARTGLGGEGLVDYIAPAISASERLNLEADIEDGS
jgi:hypothetical protein